MIRLTGIGHVLLRVLDPPRSSTPSHAIDLFPVRDPEAARRETPGVRGLGHIAQKSVYFLDPDGNTLEIYDERPDALAIFARGRSDRDVPLVFDR